MPSPASVAFMDPAGERRGIPTYSWRQAPDDLATFRQLRTQGLRPGGQHVQAQILWRTRGGEVRKAYLYKIVDAKPKRVPTSAVLAALEKALTARKTCPECGRVREYVLSRRLGVCNDCAGEWEAGAT